LIYIDENNKASLVNRGFNQAYDKRMRIGIPTFKKVGDSIYLNLIDYGFQSQHNYKLIHEKDWKIMKYKSVEF